MHYRQLGDMNQEQFELEKEMVLKEIERIFLSSILAAEDGSVLMQEMREKGSMHFKRLIFFRFLSPNLICM